MALVILLTSCISFGYASQPNNDETDALLSLSDYKQKLWDEGYPVFTTEQFLSIAKVFKFIFRIATGRIFYAEEYTGVEVDDLVTEACNYVYENSGLDIVSWAVENVLKDIYLDNFPRIMIESYGTFPGYWSMVSIDDYDKAMETVFYGSDKAEYTLLIDKIETYRNSVQLTFEATVESQKEKGIEFSNIVKYGLQTIPIAKISDVLSDATVTVNESGFGATVT